MMKAKKRKKVKTRAYVVEQMILHCKPGNHGDARKETDRKACRKFRVSREYECINAETIGET
jgi:hypothetical protein